jgi:hypothetical protein
MKYGLVLGTSVKSIPRETDAHMVKNCLIIRHCNYEHQYLGGEYRGARGSPPKLGGVAAPSRKYREASLKGADGVVP